MKCVECGGNREADERGWVVLFSPPDEPRVLYCPDCIAALFRGASGQDEQNDDEQGN